MFPVLLPAIEHMLIAAKENKVFEVCLLLKMFMVYHFLPWPLSSVKKEMEGIEKSQGADWLVI